MNVAKILLQNIKLPDTDLKFYLRSYNTNSADGSQGSGAILPSSGNGDQILPNRNLYFEKPRAVFSPLNEVAFGDGVTMNTIADIDKSFILTVKIKF